MGGATMELSSQQSQILKSVLSGRPALITGPAGTGKSFLLKRICEELYCNGVRYGVCGSTGVAAVNVGGLTLHSWAGIGLGEGHASNLAMNIRNNKAALDRVSKSRVLIVDEISMIAGELLTKIDKVFKLVRDCDLPFGGIQMVFVGDFLQLPPVDGHFAFESSAWKAAEVEVHVLTHIFRQEDEAFARALGQLRLGVIDEETRALFNSRAKAVDPNPEIKPVVITAKNAPAEAINKQNLDMLEGPSKIYYAVDTGSPSAMKLLDKGTIPKELVLKVGARVMCLVNYSPESEVMNGTTGEVISFSEGSGKPLVRFDNGAEILMQEYTREISQDGRAIGTRKQIPLRLSWACSSHKIQGQTLDKVLVIMGDAFEYSQTYVALSRVRTIEGLFIRSINKNNISANPTALAFYESAVKSAVSAD